MFASSSRIARRSRCGSSIAVGAAGLPSAALLSYQFQQTRSFRFGRLWTTYQGTEVPREDMYRRCRKSLYKYTATVIGEIRPGKNTMIDDAESTSRRFGYWRMHGRVRRNSRQEQEAGGPTMTPENPEGVRPGQNIEDVERASLEALFFRTGLSDQRPRGSTNKSTTQKPECGWNGSRGTSRAPPPTEKPADSMAIDSDSAYTIDPITNRRVYKPQHHSAAIFADSEAEPLPEVPKLHKPHSEWLRTPVPNDTPSQKSPPGQSSCEDAVPDLETPKSEQIAALDCASGSKERGISWRTADGIAQVEAPPENKRESGTSTRANGYHPILDRQILDYGSPHKYNDLRKYAPVDFSEPHGKVAEEVWDHDHIQLHDELSDRDAIQSAEQSEECKPTSVSSVDPHELEKYRPFRSHEPDGKYAPLARVKRVDDVELEQYRRPFFCTGLDSELVDRYGEEATKDSDSLGNRGFRHHESDAKHLANGTMIDAGQADSVTTLETHQPSRSREPNVRYADESSIESEGAHEAFGYDDSECRSPSTKGGKDSSEYKPDGFGTPTATQEEKSYYRQMLETYMARSAEESDSIDVQTRSTLDASKKNASGGPDQERSMTGNFVRDFPEEFARSWTTDNTNSKPSLLPTDIEEMGENDVGQKSTSSTRGHPPGDLQPALDRYSKPDGVLGNEAPSPVKPPASSAHKPTLYKILVYDPVMQRIDTAETTSVVPDSATPLTPAEVLLRISNPTKFLPHFGPLQSQGFEIVSGAGDVLVFRKVRHAISVADAISEAPEHLAAEPAVDASNSRPTINPIDMTGERRDYYIAADRFASPTGFVNYELPPARFDSGIDVRREEPVFSGPKEEPKKSSGKSLPKRLAIGAAWVAGVSYSLGVAGEYFGREEGDKRPR